MNDKTDHTEYLGKSVCQWVTTQTLFPDMTAENHGFFHPDILAYGMWTVLALAAFELNGQTPPEYICRKNHQETFEVLLRFCLSTGLTYAPGGQDLPLFVPRPFILAWGLWHNDPRAHRLTERLLGWIESVVAVRDPAKGPWVLGLEGEKSGWELFFQSLVGFELALLATLPFPGEFRLYTSGQIESAVNTHRNYPFVQVCFRRNTRTTRSVAWKALGGHPLIGFNIHSYPELLATFRASFLGIPSAGDAVKGWTVAFHYDRSQKDGFDTFGRILYRGHDGEVLLRRDCRAITWGEDGIIVFDSLYAERPVLLDEQYLSPVYLVNDVWTQNHIRFCSGSLREEFQAEQRKYREISCPSFWASIEECLLVQFVWGRTKGLYYVPGGERNAPPYWKNCRLDMLAVHLEAREVKAGECAYQVGLYAGAGKSPRPFKCTGTAGEFFKGLVIMDGKNTQGLD